ncbi:MAG: MerR family transcriptional regulator [Acidobacteria bacterium]|nr:MerR family transcriptional regulator [Acidobacteriota bacterium]
MSRRMYKVGEVAEVAKVTIRTLHHYDEIGLLSPSGRSGSGYRLYSETDIERLQHIRFYRDLGLALEEIRTTIEAEDFDARAALRAHRERLKSRLRETEALVATIDRTLRTMEGDGEMSAEERFAGFQPEEHAREAKERWGDSDSYKQSARRTAKYGKAEWEAIQAEADDIVARFVAPQGDGNAPTSNMGMALAEEYREHIDRWFYACTPQMHAGLGEMYVSDERFAAYYNKHADGLADYVCAAICANAERATA